MKTKIEISKNHQSSEYPINVRVYKSTNGIDFLYCGEGKFCKNIEEAKEYINNLNITTPKFCK